VTQLAATMFQESERREWMGLLARAPLHQLEAWAVRQPQRAVSWLRRPETGLVMVRARAGGTGEQFNLGEMTVTRCALKLEGAGCGVAYVQGRSARKAEIAALADALLQTQNRGANDDPVRARMGRERAGARRNRRRSSYAGKKRERSCSIWMSPGVHRCPLRIRCSVAALSLVVRTQTAVPAPPPAARGHACCCASRPVPALALAFAQWRSGGVPALPHRLRPGGRAAPGQFRTGVCTCGAAAAWQLRARLGGIPRPLAGRVALSDAGSWRLSGPGIRGEARLHAAGLGVDFLAQWRHNAKRFPCGVDVFLASGTRICGLPRTTRIEA
jgi:alpha-D-ribose 1-methylphosphonate 5-triphosphate synthase subunit PhnG